MSEFLLRGWNVAIPVVDVGDDVFVIDDHDKETRRIQVKTSTAEPGEARRLRATFNLSRDQLRTPQAIELYYMLMVRVEARWRFLIIPRAELFEIRAAYVENAKVRLGSGRRPRGDDEAKTDGLILTIEIDGEVVAGWDAPLGKYLDSWPDDLWVVEGGPGSVRANKALDPTAGSSGDPDPSRDPGR